MDADLAKKDSVKQRLRAELIGPNFDVDGQDFQILATIRYDPNFTTTFEGDEEFPGIDPQLASLIDGSSFLSNDEKDGFLDYFESSSGSSPVSEAFDLDPALMFKSDPFFQSFNGGEGAAAAAEDAKDLWLTYYNRFFLLGEHFKRLKLALCFFQWKMALTPKMFLSQLIQSLPVPERVLSNGDISIEDRMKLLMRVNVSYKMRVLIGKDGSMRIEAHELPRTAQTSNSTHDYIIDNLLAGFLDKPATWDIYVNPEPTVTSPFTTFKTTKRDHYNKARAAMEVLKKETPDPRPYSEVLVYNDLYQLMEGSITNVAIFCPVGDQSKAYRFTTPYLSSGCLCGVTRYFLLRKGLLQEDSIDVRDLKIGDELLLFNGIIGCVKGVIRNSVTFPN